MWTLLQNKTAHHVLQASASLGLSRGVNPPAILPKLPTRCENCSPETYFTHLEFINEKRNYPWPHIWWQTIQILDRASEAPGGRGRGIDF